MDSVFGLDIDKAAGVVPANDVVAVKDLYFDACEDPLQSQRASRPEGYRERARQNRIWKRLALDRAWRVEFEVDGAFGGPEVLSRDSAGKGGSSPGKMESALRSFVN